ncbi:MAG TPA: toxin [Cyanothece sp. UBA12306]|nr:toxin [Cyanothece sp. UBA12306]
MNFEYNRAKSQVNKSKHGMDFDEAQILWSDPFRIEIQAKSLSESRFMVVGKIDNKHWSAIITYRDNIIRIISVRRAKKSEVKLYES